MFFVAKGSITVDEISLTIHRVNDREISLMIVPLILNNTTVNHSQAGRKINIGFDYIAQIVTHNMSLLSSNSNYGV